MGGTKLAGEYTVFFGKQNKIRELGKGLFVRKRIISGFKTAESVTDRMTYIN
jgi:hypothetical protein